MGSADLGRSCTLAARNSGMSTWGFSLPVPDDVRVVVIQVCGNSNNCHCAAPEPSTRKFGWLTHFACGAEVHSLRKHHSQTVNCH